MLGDHGVMEASGAEDQKVLEGPIEARVEGSGGGVLGEGTALSYITVQ